jgi:hypothetical protein
MKKSLIVTVFKMLCVFFCSNSYGQNEKIIGTNSIENFNFPPGLALPMKFNVNLDLSHKLNHTESLRAYNDSELRVGKILTLEQLEELKEIDKVNYDYYTTANNYFENLSKKIKEIYTKNELWYIYVFDQKLKDKLFTIK